MVREGIQALRWQASALLVPLPAHERLQLITVSECKQ